MAESDGNKRGVVLDYDASGNMVVDALIHEFSGRVAFRELFPASHHYGRWRSWRLETPAIRVAPILQNNCTHSFGSTRPEEKACAASFLRRDWDRFLRILDCCVVLGMWRVHCDPGSALGGALFGGIGLGGIVTTFIVGRTRIAPESAEDDPAHKPQVPAKRKK